MLITAQEAAAIADEATTEFLNPIGLLIIEKAGQGERCILDPFGEKEGTDLAVSATRRLQEMGYTVENQHTDYQIVTVIRW